MFNKTFAFVFAMLLVSCYNANPKFNLPPTSDQLQLSDIKTNDITPAKLPGVWINLDYRDSIERGILPCDCNHDYVLAYIVSNNDTDTFRVNCLYMNDDNDSFVSTINNGSIEYKVQNQYYRFNMIGDDTLAVNDNGRLSLFVKSTFEDEVKHSLRLGTLTCKHFLSSLGKYDISPSMNTFLMKNINSFGCRDDLGRINLLTGKTKMLVKIQHDTLEFYDIVLPQVKAYPIIVKTSIHSRWPKKK